MSNAINWFEIPVLDLDRAMTFYATVTGRQLQRMEFGVAGGEEAVFATEGADASTGSLLKSARAQPSAQGSVVYLDAGASLDAALARAEAAGGEIALARQALPPGMGFFAHIMDTEGNRVGLHALA